MTARRKRSGSAGTGSPVPGDTLLDIARHLNGCCVAGCRREALRFEVTVWPETNLVRVVPLCLRHEDDSPVPCECDSHEDSTLMRGAFWQWLTHPDGWDAFAANGFGIGYPDENPDELVVWRPR